ncbi:B12-binding domain-containing radical SAM protein [Streptomyces odontomachi]|uniref:B12-binding domain-containing radical SAM protein n=1 Tax=Streptomyces odontomachi TaxID=2944940 RepID=UPI00210D0238|nr:B12-binding domain-containing radical SAM protein [Streptomyces sp. ODS25]
MSGTDVSPGQRSRLDRLRRSRLEALAESTGCDLPPWDARRYPVLAVLAPVMTSTEGEITYPGDPMCLYAALSVAVDHALLSARQGAGPHVPFSDLCPDWGEVPSRPERLAAEHVLRAWNERESVVDRTVFDPRVWDDAAQHAYRRELRSRSPRVLLISTVSPGHRYALEMARIAKEEVPHCLVVLGGRHIDETMRYLPAAKNRAGDPAADAPDPLGTLDVQYSSPLRAMTDGRIGPVVDFLVAGEGHLALDLLLRAVSLTMDLDRRRADPTDVVGVLDLLGEAGERIPGSSLICAVTDDAVHAFPVRGPAHDLADLPSPYQGFAIRSRFPVFPLADGSPARTAHLTVSNACPYHCDFCSEAATVVGGLKRFGRDPAAVAVERVCEYVSYGAQAVFFDDSIFWSGTFPLIRAFCAELTAVRQATQPDDLPPACLKWITEDDDWRRLRGLQFGAQVTVDLMTVLHKEDEVRQVLAAMREAGCTYIYMGIESMASDVMQHVHKNVRRVAGRPWKAKVRRALELIKEAGIPVGSSVLFGLEGETRETIQETVHEVGLLIDDGLIGLASPNILTYHPGTAITRAHGMADRLDYHSPQVENRPPYIYFEEAFPEVVSRRLTEDDIWFIHEATAKRWGIVRNSAAPD